MCFLDIDEIEISPVLVFRIERIEGTDLVPKGRSSVTAEDQHDRPLVAAIRKPHLIFPNQ